MWLFAFADNRLGTFERAFKKVVPSKKKAPFKGGAS
jgi:hypothetical protein